MGFGTTANVLIAKLSIRRDERKQATKSTQKLQQQQQCYKGLKASMGASMSAWRMLRGRTGSALTVPVKQQ